MLKQILQIQHTPKPDAQDPSLDPPLVKVIIEKSRGEGSLMEQDN